MKTKWIFRIVTFIMISSIFLISQGGDKFYYGAYMGRPEQDFPSQRDSLRFNINYNLGLNDSTMQYWRENALRAIVAQDGTGSSPTYWSKISHYTLWEAEGLAGSWVNLQYDGGTLVDDDSASGGKAMKFSGPGTPGIIQTGPSYYQEPLLWGSFIAYTAEFQLKYSLDTLPEPPTPVCSIMVVDRGTILRDTVIYTSDFGGGGATKYFRLKITTCLTLTAIELNFKSTGSE